MPALESTTHRVLPNGLTILLRESHRSPVVELQIWAGVGSADERPGEEGLAHFHEHMLFKGTERRAVGEVAGEIEGLGGHINAYTSFDSTVYHATLPSASWRAGLDVLTDAVRHSIFDDDEIAREREVVLEEIRRSEDTPGHVLGELAFRECYRKHPYGLPILGPASNVAGFDRSQVLAFFQRWYTPDNLMVVAIGDFDSAEVASEIERLFEGATSGNATRTRPAEPAPDALRVAVLRKAFEGHRVDLSWPASRFRDQDATHLDLLAYVLGECESSRLVRRIREKEALVDRIDAGAYTPLDRGLFSIGFETDSKRLLDATRRIVEEVDRLRREPVSKAELERARVNFLASEQFDRESVSGVASKLGSFEAMGGGWQREAEALETLRTARPDDLLRVAQRYLSPEALTIAALIPESTEANLDEQALRQAVALGIEAASNPRDGARAESTPARDRASVGDGPIENLRFGPMRPAADGAGERLDARLSNGLDLHVLRRPEVPVVAIRLASLGGLLCEDESNSGITRFLAAMWTRGTRMHSAAAFARQVEGLAAEIDGFSGRNSIGLTLDCLSESLEPAFDLFSEALLDPRLDPEEIERERRESLAALERRQDRLGQRAFQLFAETEFERHPYRMTVLGEPETVAAFSADDLLRHANELVRADRAAISVVGDVDPEVVGRLVEKRLGPMHTGTDHFVLPTEEPRSAGVRESELIKDRAQAHLVIGFRGITLGDPDRDVLELIAQLLAGQGGRLFLELRDRQSLAYTVAASNVEGLAPGYFTIYIATAPEKVERARAGIFEEIDRLVTHAPSPEELKRAINFGTGSFAIGSQRSHSRAAHIALDSVYGLGPDHTEGYPAAIAAVTPEDVLRVAQRIFRLDAYSESAVHP
jgi:zinc protease